MAIDREGIRLWQKNAPYSRHDFKVYRVYAQTLENSDSTLRLVDSKESDKSIWVHFNQMSITVKPWRFGKSFALHVTSRESN